MMDCCAVKYYETSPLTLSLQDLQTVVKAVRSSYVKARVQAALVPPAFLNGFLSNVTTLLQC